MAELQVTVNRIKEMDEQIKAKAEELIQKSEEQKQERARLSQLKEEN